VKNSKNEFSKEVISDFKSWLSENIDSFEKFSMKEATELTEDLKQIRLTVYIVEQWFETKLKTIHKSKIS